MGSGWCNATPSAIALKPVFALVENMVKKNRSHFAIAVLLTTILQRDRAKSKS
jgi:hypothetical protein